MRSVAKITVVLVQLTGLILSVALVFLTYLNPKQIEERLQQFVVAEVQAAADAAWFAAGLNGDSSNVERLGALSDKLGGAALTLDRKREQIVQAMLAQTLSENCTENCDFWSEASRSIDEVMLARIYKLRLGQATLQEFVLERYEKSLDGLLRDLRRFGLVNAVVLALMMGLGLFRNQLTWRFWAFSIVVTGYVVWAAYGYIFNQDWAFSILLQDWAAPAYQLGMMFAACLFSDWLFLRGRVTQMVSNLVASIFPG